MIIYYSYFLLLYLFISLINLSSLFVFPKMNIEHPTSNIQRRMWFVSVLNSVFLGIQPRAKGQRFDVQRSMFDVGRSFGSLWFWPLWAGTRPGATRFPLSAFCFPTDRPPLTFSFSHPLIFLCLPTSGALWFWPLGFCPRPPTTDHIFFEVPSSGALSVLRITQGCRLYFCAWSMFPAASTAQPGFPEAGCFR